MSVRVSAPAREWLRLTFSGVVPPLGGIDEIPGVSLQGRILEIPKTAITLSEVGAVVLDETGDLLERHYQQRWPRFSPFAIPIVHNFGLSEAARGRQLFRWQMEAVDLILGRGSVLLADEMGLGKTTSAIFAAELSAINDSAKPRIVIAPLFTLDTWRRELLACSAILEPFELCVLRTRNADPKAIPGYADAKWYFVSYDLVPYWAPLLSAHKRGRPSVVIVDEIHRAKNPAGKQAKATLLLAAGAQVRIGLTGTPMDKPRDLFMPMQIVTGPRSWGSFSSYRTRYCGAYHEGFGLVDHGPSNTDELKKRIAPFYLRRTIKTSGIQLPALMRKQHTAFLTEAQRNSHTATLGKTNLDELVDAILNGRGGSRTFELLAKARKITSKAKLGTTIDVVTDLRERGDSVVVFVHERETADYLANALFDQCVKLPESRAFSNVIFTVHGGFGNYERNMAVQAFREEGGILVATYGALREGVTLTKANHVVLHDLGWNGSEILQAEARVYRIGQGRPTFAHWVCAEDSVDTLFARVLLAKSAQTDQVLGLDEARVALEEIGLQDFAPKAFDPKHYVRDVLSQWRGGE